MLVKYEKIKCSKCNNIFEGKVETPFHGYLKIYSGHCKNCDNHIREVKWKVA